MNSKIFLGVALVSSLLVFVSCQKHEPEQEFVIKEVEKPVLGVKKEAPAEAPAEEAPATAASSGPDLEKGKKIWTTVCIQCHNKDPNVKGPIGPETVDAPEVVMLSKVTTGKYPEVLPPGFVPKRKTHAMRALPQYADDVPSIWAYVQSVKKAK